MAKTPFDSGLVRSLASLLDETNLSEIEYETEGTRIRVARQITYGVAAPAAAQMMAAPAAAPVATATPIAADPASHPGAQKSPMVGVVYMSPEPGKPAFVQVGDSVAVGQTLCLIEAMKTYNPIRSTKAGKIIQIIAEDGSPVEYGEALVIVE